MTYSHLTTAELTTIVNFFTQGTKAYKVAQMLKRSVEWSPVNKIDNLNRDFFVLCHD